MAQNIAKLVVMPRLRTLKENRQFTETNHDYQTKRVHRYLGTQYITTSTNQQEITMRIRAANRGWAELRGVWFDENINMRLKRLFFIGAVQSAALSGMNALCLCKEDYKKLDRTLVKKMRAAMMGKAAVIDEHGVRKSIRSTEVWKR